jgi:hypothetical protein
VTTDTEIVTAAYRALQAIDINELPSPNETKIGLDTLPRMIAEWATRNLNVVDQALSGTTTLDSPVVTGIETEALAKGFNVSGGGIPAATRIASLDHRNRTITLTANATASATVTLTFTLLPLETRYEQGLIAMLAMQLAPQLGMDNIPAVVTRNAYWGWKAILGNFFRVPVAKSDLPRPERVSILREDNG